MTEDLPPSIPPAGHGVPAKKRGWGFWLAIAGGVLTVVCCGGGAVVWYAGREWFAIAAAPEGERERLFSKKLEEAAGDQMTPVDAFLAAVDEQRDEDAWNLASPSFHASTTREKFGEL